MRIIISVVIFKLFAFIEDRNDGYTRDRDDYHNRYDKRHHVERTALRSSGHHSRYERSSSQSRYSE